MIRFFHKRLMDFPRLGGIAAVPRMGLKIDHRFRNSGNFQIFHIVLGGKFTEKSRVPIVNVHIAQVAAADLFVLHKTNPPFILYFALLCWTAFRKGLIIASIVLEYFTSRA